MGKRVGENKDSGKVVEMKIFGAKKLMLISAIAVLAFSLSTPVFSQNDDSPFGIMAAFDSTTLTTISVSDKIAWAGEKFRDLGAKWSRGAREDIIWGNIEPEFGEGYSWANSDEVLKNVYENGGENFNMVVIISSQRVKGGSSDIPLDKEDYFSSFVEALVERYDGDGIDDYDSNIKVKYWQMANEPFPNHWEDAGGTIEGYVRFAELTHNAIKKSDPDAKIILGTFQLETTEQINKFKEVIPKMKNKNMFDYVDTHFWERGDNYKIPVNEARDILNSNGYSNAKMVSLEFGTWLGPRVTEKDQAKYVIKGYVYNIASGFSLINWNNLVEWNAFGGDPESIYNFMGLIADGVNGDPGLAGTPRLSYYTYKKMTEILEGSDWNNIETIPDLPSGVYASKFIKDGKPIWAAWSDNPQIDGQTEEIEISGIPSGEVTFTYAVPKYELGSEVGDYNSAFETGTMPVIGEKITVDLAQGPVFIESSGETATGGEAPYVTLGNSLTELTFNINSANTLQSITNLGNSHTFDFNNSPLWKITLLDTHTAPAPYVIGNFTELKANAPNAYNLEVFAGSKKLTLYWNNFQGMVDVKVEVELFDDDPLSHWKIGLSNYTGSRYAIFAVDFPLMYLSPLGSAADDYMVWSALSGTLIKDPCDNAKGKVNVTTDINSSGNAKPGEYPGIWGMQFAALYDDDGSDGAIDGLGGGDGLYLAAYDLGGYRKRFSFFGNGSMIEYFIRHYPENNNAIVNNYGLNYDCIVSPFTGDWIDASKIYRDWALQQPWCSSGALKQRADLSQPLVDTDLILSTELATVYGNTPADIYASITGVNGWSDFFGPEITLIEHLRGWGTYVPLVAPKPGVADLINDLLGKGIKTIPYTNHKDWPVDEKDANGEVIKSYEDSNGTREKAKAKNINGDDIISTYERGNESNVMDPSTQIWRDKVLGFAKTLQDKGATDLYLDTFPHAKLCYRSDSDHTHPSGGGKYWIEGAKEMFSKVRQQGRNTDPGYFIANESKIELLIKDVDALFAPFWSRWTDGTYVPQEAGLGAVPVPLFQSVYHDYTVTFGSLDRYWGELLNGNACDGLHFRFAHGYSFIQGNKLLLTDNKSEALRTWAADEEKDMLYLKDLLSAYNLGKEYFVYGEWMRPPEVGVENTDIEVFGKTYVYPKVLASAFKTNGGGSLLLVFTNYNDEAVTADFALELDKYGLSSSVYEIKEMTGLGYPDTILKERIYNGSFNFPGRSVLLLEVKEHINQAPVAESQSVSLNEDNAQGIILAANDLEADALTYQVSNLLHGALSGTAPFLVYNPELNYNGADSFTFTVTDIHQAGSNIATVSLLINPVNDAPALEPITNIIYEDQRITIIPVAADVDGDTLTYSVSGLPQGADYDFDQQTGKLIWWTTSVAAGEYDLAITVDDGKQ